MIEESVLMGLSMRSPELTSLGRIRHQQRESGRGKTLVWARMCGGWDSLPK